MPDDGGRGDLIVEVVLLLLQQFVTRMLKRGTEPCLIGHLSGMNLKAIPIPSPDLRRMQAASSSPSNKDAPAQLAPL